METIMKVKFTVAMCAMLLAACVQQADAPTPVAKAEPGTRSAVQEGDFSTLSGEWVASSLEGGPGDVGSPITMTLKTTGEFAGSAGCNRYFGRFVWAEGKLGSGPVGSTMMACEESIMAQEYLYLGLLPRVAHINKTDGRLQLLDEQDLVLVEMLAADPAR